MRILIADDEAVNQRVLARMAERLGYRAAVVGDGKGLVEAFMRDRPGAVLCDIHLGADDGVALCSRLRELDPLVPIKLMTGDPGAIARAEAAGFSRVLSKPFTSDALKEALSALRP